MNDTANPTPNRSTRRFQFSIGAVLLWVVIVGLVASNVIVVGELASLKEELAKHQQELASYRPLSPEDVARQFEKRTTFGPIATTVNDVRYSVDRDSYKVRFSWTSATTIARRSSEVELAGNDYGEYYGKIHFSEFLDAQGGGKFFSVVVKSASPLENRP